MEFGVLGPLEVLHQGESLQLGGPKQRTVLAHLLLRANNLVTVERLIDALWGEEPPASARNTLQTYIKHLRKLVGSERIEHMSSGYVLRVEPGELDLLRFESLVEEAAVLGPSDLAAGARGLRVALSLWRGPALDDLAEQPPLRPEITRLEELRIATVEERIGADLALGRHHELVPELETFVAHHPFRERAWGYLMVALYRSGRQGDALAAYGRAREVLNVELGIDPSPELQHTQEQVLKQDVALDLDGEPLRGYRLLELLGEGAFGAVHRALQPEVGREVAVKIVHPRLAKDPEFIRRFAAEAQLVARLEHPHIVAVYDYWRDPDGAYLVMRYLRGGSLRRLLTAEGPLEPDRAAQVIDDVARALAAAHRVGVVHRDVQPTNILFDEEGNTYLSDFGIARDLATARGARGRTSPGDIAYYLSPEEARGEPATQRADTYSLGLVLYECLTGRRAVAGSPTGEHREERREPIPPVTATRPDLPAAIDAVVGRATANDPAERYPDVLELAAAARPILDGLAIRTGDGLVLVRNPYKGLRAFSEADAEDFFGREELVGRLVERFAVDVERSRFLGVVGPSGSGKSSLVRAGLIPALRAGALPGSETWFYTEMTPGREPFDELAAALLRISVDAPPGFADRLERDERGLVDAAERVLPGSDPELVLVVDQFEELFTLVDDDDVRARFLASLAGAVADPRSRLRVVVTLRADFYDRPLAYQGFGELLGSGAYTLTPLTPRDLARAVAGPAEAVGVTVEPALVTEVSVEFSDRPGALPLLEYALTEAFERRGDHELTLDAYRAIGGMSGALARRAEAFYEGLDDTGKGCVRQLFLRLVALGEDSVETRRRVPRTELASVRVDGRPVDSVADTLGASRLVSFDRDPVTRGPTVEVAHEALLRGWDRLAGWIDKARDDLRTNRGLEHDAAEWKGGDCDPSFLLRGSRLEQIETWMSRTDLALTALTREYVDASLRERNEEGRAEEVRRQREASLRRRSVNRLRRLVAVLAVGALVAASLALVARDRGRLAEREARVATARELAGAAVANIDVDAEQSLRLALEAVQTTYRVDGTALPAAIEALHRALQADRLVFTVPGYSASYSDDGSRLLVVGTRGYQEGGRTPVRVLDAETGARLQEATGSGRGDAAFSPDGEFFATSVWSGDGPTFIWETSTGEGLWRDEGHGGQGLVFSPDSRLLAYCGGPNGCGGHDPKTYVFDVRTGEEGNVLQGVGPLAFAPDGERLLIGDAFWDRPTAAIIVDPLEPNGGSHGLTLVEDPQVNVYSGAWSRDGSSVATLGGTSVAVWDARSGKERFAIFPPSGSFASVTFGPHSLLATGMEDGTALVWALSADGAEPILTVGGHRATVSSVSFNADGTRLATSSDDGSVKVWDVSGQAGGEWMTVAGSGAVAFSPDGRSIATGTREGNVIVYDATTGRAQTLVRRHTGPINSVAFDPTGSRIASAGSDGTFWLSDAATGKELWRKPERRFDSWVSEAVFSPDGRTVATAAFANDNPLDLWEAETGDHLRTLPYYEDDANASHAATFSADGRFVAGSSYTFVRVWRLADDSYVQIRVGVVNTLAFNPDGDVLASGASDGSLRLWDPRTGRELVSVSPNLGEVTGVAFSPDGDRLATSSSDGTVRLWDGRTLDPIMTLATDGAGIPVSTTKRPIGKVAFSPDGARLAYTARGGVVRVLALDIDDLIRLARSRLERAGSAT
jgi:WD40 repeat protein/DNA-binding SARP family transcriptional activator/energy-coupling factor transporter ATP-binding protein EcfA2